MERYEFSEREKQLLRALSEGKTPEELEQLFDTDVLETDLNRLQELEMAVAHFSEDGVVAAWLTSKGSAYMKENPNLDPPESVIIRNMQKEKLEYERRKENTRLRNPVNYQWVMAMVALLSLIVAFLAWVTRCGD